MQKLLIYLACFASLQLTACSSSEERNKNTPRSSWLETIPLVYRQDIQQGNIVTQDTVNRLEPGMSKRQVRFLLGTPMLIDAFHTDRWDYVYTMTEGWGDTEQKHLSLFFADDRLVKLEGDYRPDPEGMSTVTKKDAVISVPDYVDPDAGIFTRAVKSVSGVFDDTSDAADKTTAVRDKAEEQAIEAEAAQEMSNPAPGAN